MGRQGFRLVDILPTSWFYKLKDKNMPARASSSTTATTTTDTPTTQCPSPPRRPPPPAPPPKEQHPINHGTPSYYIPSNDDHRPMLSGSPLHPKASDTKFLVDPPRKSKKKPRRIRVNRPPPSNTLVPSISHNNKSATLDFDSATPILDLPPIQTRPKKREDAEEPKSPKKRSSGGGRGIRIRANSPRLASKRVQPCRSRGSGGDGTRKGLAGSFPVVKPSANPQKDFRESMVEVIVENDITSAEEMEELLACYLSLNSKQYHDVIVEVFVQIWFELTGVRL